jgi:hypothetical protein
LRNKSIFQISTLVCLSSTSICNLLTDFASPCIPTWLLAPDAVFLQRDATFATLLLSHLLNPLKIEFLLIYINPVRTSQETHHVSATKPNRLMLFRETVAVYCENHTENTNTLCGQCKIHFTIDIRFQCFYVISKRHMHFRWSGYSHRR